MTVKITAPDLNAVEASSGSSIRASGIKSDAFALKVSSGASAELSGTCGTMTVKASSGGSADAKLGGQYAAAAIAGMTSAVKTSTSLTRRSVGGFKGSMIISLVKNVQLLNNIEKEIIIINDCSTDNTREIVEKLLKK